MGADPLSHGRVARVPLWLLALVAIAVVVGVVVGPVTAARAQVTSAPLERAMHPQGEQLEDLPGRFPTSYYVITFEVSPLIKSCDMPDVKIPTALGGFQVPGWATELGCIGIDFSFIGDVFWGLLTELAFGASRVISMIGLWMTELVYEFKVVQWLETPAEVLSGRMHSTFVAGIRLDAFVVFLAVFYSGMQLLRRRLVQGLKELLISLLVATIGAMLVASPGWLLRSVVPFTVGMSGAMLQLTSDDEASMRPAEGCTGRGRDCVPRKRAPAFDENDYHSIARRLTDQLHTAMVDQPYDLVNWGELLADGSACAAARDRIVGEDQSGDEGRRTMRDAGEECHDNADFNADSSFERFVMASISAAIAIMIFVLLGIIDIGILGSQFVFAGLLVITPLLVVVGTLPGVGRQVMLRGIGAGGKAAGATVVGTFILTMLVVIIYAILGLPPDKVSYIGRFVVLLVAVFMLIRFRRRVADLWDEIIVRATERFQTQGDDQGFGSNLLRPAVVGVGVGVGGKLLEKATGTMVDKSVGRITSPRRRRHGAGGDGNGSDGDGAPMPKGGPTGVPGPSGGGGRWWQQGWLGKVIRGVQKTGAMSRRIDGGAAAALGSMADHLRSGRTGRHRQPMTMHDRLVSAAHRAGHLAALPERLTTTAHAAARWAAPKRRIKDVSDQLKRGGSVAWNTTVRTTRHLGDLPHDLGHGLASGYRKARDAKIDMGQAYRGGRQSGRDAGAVIRKLQPYMPHQPPSGGAPRQLTRRERKELNSFLSPNARGFPDHGDRR
jgi:hypothetical protein